MFFRKYKENFEHFNISFRIQLINLNVQLHTSISSYPIFENNNLSPLPYSINSFLQQFWKCSLAEYTMLYNIGKLYFNKSNKSELIFNKRIKVLYKDILLAIYYFLKYFLIHLSIPYLQSAKILLLPTKYKIIMFPFKH